MSKKNVSNVNNTLLKYFTKTSQFEKKKKEHDEENLLRDPNKYMKSTTSGNIEYKEFSSNKRTRLFVNDESFEEKDGSDVSLFEGGDSDEYKPSGSESDSNSDGSLVLKTDSETFKESRSSIKLKTNKSFSQKAKKPKLDNVIQGSTFSEKLSNQRANIEASKKYRNVFEKMESDFTVPLLEQSIWPHHKLDFLQPENIRDKKRRRPDHPDYDPNTIFVPESYLAKCSPGLRQWWNLKSENFDCIIFFKLGKFYELYHMDADIGVSELGCTYMKGEFAHSGFPEVSYDKMSSILIERGYKVARVEQTETPNMMHERHKNYNPSKVEKKADKIVRREICQITSRGTQVYGIQCQISPNFQPNYLLIIVEKDKGSYSQYGVTFIDTSIGDFHLGEFEDDNNCSRLSTMLSHHFPVLVVYERHTLSEKTHQIFRSSLSGVKIESLQSSDLKTISVQSTIKYLKEKYFCSSVTSENHWPKLLREIQSHFESFGTTVNEKYILSIKALGYCIYYLNKCRIEEKVLPMARYYLFVPPDMLKNNLLAAKSFSDSISSSSHMVLDAATLTNLQIIGEHSLFNILDNCCTKFGKRLLHNWLCLPSCDVTEISKRQEAITDILNHQNEVEQIRLILASLPDFDRYVAQIQLFGNKYVFDSHPDGKAVMFEEKLYNKKKIKNFTITLKGLNDLLKISLLSQNFNSNLIKRITQTPKMGGEFPEMLELLTFFKNAFDHDQAHKTGVITLQKGVDADLDECESKITKLNESLEAYLLEQQQFFGCKVKYYGSEKKRYQLEVPGSHAKVANANYTLEGQTKGKNPTVRYVTNETKDFLKRMLSAEEERNGILKDVSRRIFERFAKNYSIWKKAIDFTAYLDVIISLAEYARRQTVICIPQVLGFSEKPLLKMENGYHPCMDPATFVPNGISLGYSGIPPLCLLTGPNMGGKSTLMRQIGCLIVMAQIGAHVPAESFHLSVVDRIFTRLGAQDDILTGQSTFLVELKETSLILKHTTVHSLVLLDELGRGTATFDGTAIAASVVNFLSQMNCRSIFSTHYHNLIEYFYKHNNVILGHMACMVEKGHTDDPTQETIIFLYKYCIGTCPKSYGFNAAKLAGMPHTLIKRAYELSKQVEISTLKRKIAIHIFRNLAQNFESDCVRTLFAQLRFAQN